MRFAVCSSASNTELLGQGEVLSGFTALLRDPDAVGLIDLEAVLARIETIAPPALTDWTGSLTARYAGI